VRQATGRRRPDRAGYAKGPSGEGPFDTVPVKSPGTSRYTELLLRFKGIYHAGCTGYPNPTYP
jgi:hypothetical protein